MNYNLDYEPLFNHLDYEPAWVLYRTNPVPGQGKGLYEARLWITHKRGGRAVPLQERITSPSVEFLRGFLAEVMGLTEIPPTDNDASEIVGTWV